MSYTEFEYGNLEVRPPKLPQKAAADEVTVSVSVHNTGDRAGETVVPVYGTREHGEVLYPQQVVVGFERVSLDAGETTRVDIRSTVLRSPPSLATCSPAANWSSIRASISFRSAT
ncbi:hypothetical protein BG842_20145 [Haladaptatus sp. W1]|nr:hypothetical protein BG842_20145 [Haladaptatus sp. W1]